MTDVFRAPMRSRDDSVDHGAAVEWALVQGWVGVGGMLPVPPSGLEDAVRAVWADDGRTAERLRRFADMETGSFVWTRDADGSTWLGQVGGPWSFDSGPTARRHDLQHVRRCLWMDESVPLVVLPRAVAETFRRGGRNFQRINDPSVPRETERVWSVLG